MSTACSAIAAAAIPACAAALATLSKGSAGHAALFRSDAAGLVAAVAVGAFVRPTRLGLLAALVAAPLLLAAVHAAIASSAIGEASGTSAILRLGMGVALAAAGLAALGRSLAAPGPAAGALSACTLWLACGGIWWVDTLAERVDTARRPAVREAVLRVDPLTAASYDAAGYDRLHAPDVYESAVVATTTVPSPHAGDTAMLWGAVGVAAAAASRIPRRRRIDGSAVGEGGTS